MPWGLLFLPLLGGYLFLHKFHLTRYRAKALQDHRLLFESAVVALIALALARLAVLVILAIPGAASFPPILFWKGAVLPFPFSGTCVGAFILCVVSPFVLNKRLDKDRAAEKAYEDLGDELVRLLSKAHRVPLPVMLTLKNDKVYVGFVRSMSPPGPSRPNYLTILPVMSGYRDNQRRLCLNVDYRPVYHSLEAKKPGGIWSVEEYSVVIAMTEILTATTYVQGVPTEDFHRHPDDPSPEF